MSCSHVVDAGAFQIIVNPSHGADDKVRQMFTSIMETLQPMSELLRQLTDQVAANEAAIAQLQVTVDAKQEALALAIATLQDTIANGVDPTALAGVIARLQAATAAVDAINTDVADTPVPEAAPIPVDPAPVDPTPPA